SKPVTQRFLGSHDRRAFGGGPRTLAAFRGLARNKFRRTPRGALLPLLREFADAGVADQRVAAAAAEFLESDAALPRPVLQRLGHLAVVTGHGPDEVVQIDVLNDPA